VNALTEYDRGLIARARALTAMSGDEIRARWGDGDEDRGAYAAAFGSAQAYIEELARIAERCDGTMPRTAEDTWRLGEIRALLARFDWERDDRQLALEAVERIADGDEDQADEENEPETYCRTCGADVGIFIGHGGAWLHYTGQGTVASPVELYDAGHVPDVAWRPAGAHEPEDCERGQS
jgi:hypothetical protein